MKTNHLLAAGLLAAFLAPISARAATALLTPTDGFRILSLYPGHEPGLWSVYNDGGGNVQHTILLFDFSSIPAGATIESAILTLSTYGGWSQPLGTQSDVYALAVPWDDTAIWISASSGIPWVTPGGDVTGAPYATNSLARVAGEPVEWDVTSLVTAWDGGSLSNYGMLLAATPGDTMHFTPSTEILAVTYTAPEPASAALLGLGTLLLAARRRRSA